LAQRIELCEGFGRLAGAAHQFGVGTGVPMGVRILPHESLVDSEGLPELTTLDEQVGEALTERCRRRWRIEEGILRHEGRDVGVRRQVEGSPEWREHGCGVSVRTQ